MAAPPSSRPMVYALLAEAKSPAADAALLAALPELEPPYLAFALDTLIYRERPQGLAHLLAGFGGYPPGLRAEILARAAELEPALRAAIARPEAGPRTGALAMIADSGDAKLSYLATAALSVPDETTRASAARTLEAFAERRGQSAIDDAVGHLAEALCGGLRAWELHRRPELLRASAWCIDLTAPVLHTLLNERRSSLAPALGRLFRQGPNVRLVPYTLWALAEPALHDAAACFVADCEERAFMEGLVQASWALRTESLRARAVRIRELRWLRRSLDPLLTLGRVPAQAAVRFIAATGVASEAKASLLIRLANGPNLHAARTALALLSRLRSDAARIALWRISKQPDHPLQAAARRVLDRTWHGPPARETASVKPRSPLVPEDAYRLAADADPLLRSRGVAALRRIRTPTAARILRQALHDPDPRVQANALEATESVDWPGYAALLAEKLASDIPRVRACAARGLLKRADPRGAAALLELLSGDSHAQRLAGLWVAGSLRLTPLARRLRWLGEHDPDHEVRHRARQVLESFQSQPPSAAGERRQPQEVR